MTKTLYELGDQVDDAVNELLLLWPQLAHALQRDAGTSENERVTTSASVHTLPMNMDVLGAIRILQQETWPAALEARTLLNEPGAFRGTTKTIESCAILYRRLVGRGYDTEARELARIVLRWQHVTRTAIGLSRRAKPLHGDGEAVFCPLHDAPLVQLRLRGDEGTVNQDTRGNREAITWRSGGGLYCPHKGCRGEWGPSEFPFLGRLVAEQRARLAQHQQAEQVHKGAA